MGSTTSSPADTRSRSDTRGGLQTQDATGGSVYRPIDPADSRTNSSTTNSNMPAAEPAAQPTDLAGMALVNYQCRKSKKRYRKCMNDYYSREFMSGRSMEQDCHDKFEEYRQCVLRGIKSEIWDKQGLPPPKEGSPLADLDDP